MKAERLIPLLERLRKRDITPEQALELLRESERPCERRGIVALPHPPIAVIGMSGRFPGAPNLEAYWRNLTQGVISVREVPPDRWRAADYYDPDASLPGKSNSKWGGFLDGIDLFDPLFFSLSPREAELMDPQQRLFLTEAWRALEQAGYGGAALDKQACGVFVGCGVGDYLRNLQEHGVSPDALAFLGNSNPILAARISFLLNLRGPSVAIDTACSSSLVAVQLACESIASGTSTMALAGGVSIFTTPLTHLLAGKAAMLSPSGRCFTFDERADGFVPAEGVGVVVLKRLDLAQRDGDQIHGVVVASGINQDGRSNGITAPSATSQTALIREVYARFGIDPESISLVEAHGTGTRLGDPIEVSALTDAFASPRTGFCPLGSVKANIGHASTAAGIAGLLKVLLCLKHRQHVPLAGFQRLNPHIDLARSPFRLLDRAAAWEEPRNGRRLAALSSFGFSGTNAHLVVAEAPPQRSASGGVASAPAASTGNDDRHLFVVSARDDDALRTRCRELAGWLRVHPEASARDLSYTLLLGRCHFRKRHALVATREELIAALDRLAQGSSTDVADASSAAGTHEKTLDRAQLAQHGRDSLNRIGRTVSASTDAEAELAVLAACYHEDVALDWSQLFPGQPARLELPSYPFQERRYWIPVELQRSPASPACPGHPLLDRIDLQDSTGAGLVFEKTIHPALPLVDEHQVMGEKVLPGMAFLEMALAAGRTLIPGRTWRITDLVWSAPLIVADEPLSLRLIVKRQDGGYSFHFESDSGRHCHGVLHPAQAETAVRHAPEAMIAHCPEVQSGQGLYAFFERRGLVYGPSFQGLEEVFTGVDQLVGRLQLPRGAHPGQGLYWMNPAMADAALQAAVCLFARPGQAEEGLLLPYSLAEAHVPRPLPETGFACARTTGERCLELVILDENGELCARFKGLVLRPLLADRLAASARAQRRSRLAVDAPVDPELSAFMEAFARMETWAIARLWQVLEPRLPPATYTRDQLSQHLVIAPRFRRLGETLLDLLVAGGWLESRGGAALARTGKARPGRAALEEERHRIDERSPWIQPFTRLTEGCTANLLEILAGTLDVTRVLFPTGSAEDVAGIYGSNPLADRYNRTTAELAADVAVSKAKLRPVRILEIGGGTGATTRVVLEALAPLAGSVSYLFTDISPAFVRQAAADLAQPFAAFRVFDLERDPRAQGLAADFDLILASNVVHATGDIAASLGHLQKLLRPGGVLLLNEITGTTAFGALTFGLTDGWWRFRDEAKRLPGAPLLAPKGWIDALRDAGFRDTAAYGEALCAEGPIDHRVFMAVGGQAIQALAAEAETAEMALVARNPGSSIDQDGAYVCRILASVLKVPESQLVPDRHLEEYGVDSLVTQQVVSAFEPDLGRLPATLVFEHPTAARIAAYLREHQGAALDAVHARRGRTISIFDAEVRATASAVIPPEAAPATLPRVPVSQPPGAGPLDIAIVGVAGRYPLAPDLETFWRNLVEGRDCITEVPPERWDWRLYHDRDPDATGRSYTARAGFIDQVDAFDARFFRISPREAEAMDPQERLFLETAWHTVENAGYDPLRLGEKGRIGVFVGVMNANYSQLGSETWRVGERVRGKTAYWSIANRVSFCLDYRGPSMAVDTACSSSLTAIHLACQSLVRGECELALAGGVNLILHPAHLVCLSDMHMLSPTGQCRAFGEGADGFVDGEGVGAVLLKPLAQALADRDSILAVIKGSALNCGGRTTGFTVPSPEAQASVVADALAQSEVPAETIGYVEAHGTGTALGDPIEIAGLRRAFGIKPTAIAFGSVKTQIGHLESAAGIVGLTKLVLQLEHRRLAPSLHADTLNPRLELGPFHLLQQDAAWPRPALETVDGPRSYPRSAGLSSFGAGGANAHLVLQEGPDPVTRRPPANGPVLLPFSARTPDRLAALLRRHSAFLQSHPADEHFMSDLAFTLQTGRTPMATRVAFVAHDPDSLRALIDAHLSGLGPTGQVFTSDAGEDPGLPLEGKAGEAYISTALAEREWNVLARVWVAGARVDFTALWTDEPKRIALPTYPFERTRHWLPVLHPSGISPATSRRLLGPLSPAASLGQGLAFSIDLSTDSPLLRDHRVDGAAVLPGVATLVLAQAAWSELRPGEPCRLSGIQWLKPLAPEQTRALTFRVRESGTTLRFELADGGTLYAQGQFESRSATTAEEQTPDPAALGARFGAWQDGGSIYAGLRAVGIEHGPFFQVMSRFASLDHEALADLALTESARLLSGPWHPALLDGALQTLGAIGDLAHAPMLPFGIGRVRFLQPPGPECRCHAARTGPDSFDVSLYGADGRPSLLLENVTVRPRGDPLKDLFFTPRWSRVETELEAASSLRSAVIVFDRASAALAGGLEARLGEAQALLISSDDAGDARTLALSDPARWQAEMASFQDPCHIYFLAGGESPADADRGVVKLFRFLRTLLHAGGQDRSLRLSIVTTLACPVFDEDPVSPFPAALHGLALSAAREIPRWLVTITDTDGNAGERLETILRNQVPVTQSIVAERKGVRYTRRLVPLNLPACPSPYRRNGVYLIVGGTGGIGMVLAADLLRRFDATLFLLGRAELDPHKRQQLAALDPSGTRVHHLRADVTDRHAVQKAIEAAEGLAGPINGVFHAALVLRDRGLRAMDEQTFLEALAPKLAGSVILDASLGDRPLDFMAFFSSAQSFLGNAGQANYAAGCTFIDAWAHHLSRLRPYPVRVLNWGYWGEVGAVATPEYRERLTATGIQPLSTHRGLAATERALGAGCVQVVPFRAEARFLESVGIRGAGAVSAREIRYPSLVPAVAHALERPVDGARVDAVRQGTKTLDRAAARLFHAALIQTGIVVPGQILPTSGAAAVIASRHERLLHAALTLLIEYGLVSRTATGLQFEPLGEQPERAELDRRFPDLAAYTDLLFACAPHYGAILRGTMPAPDALFPEGSSRLVSGIYRGHALAEALNDLGAAAVTAFVARCPAERIRILEVGGGTGGTTEVLLPALAPHAGRVTYVFGDLSHAFVKEARRRFETDYPFARFETLDISRPPAYGNHYDVLIAANVLHATTDLRRTLGHVASLLRPNGMLVLNEVTTPSPFATLTFGLLDGWWSYQDELRMPGGPLVSGDGWAALLRESGFRSVSVHGFADIGQNLILAEAGVVAPQIQVAPPPGVSAEAGVHPIAVPVLVRDAEPIAPAPPSAGPAPASRVAGEPSVLRQIEASIVTAVSQTLEVDPGELNVDTPHMEFGLDSILAVEVISRLNKSHGWNLSPTDVFNHPTIRSMARHVAETHDLTRVPASDPDRGPGVDLATIASPAIGAEDVAVIGMACRFPGANSLEAFWALLREGRDAVAEVTADRWDVGQWFDPDPRKAGKTMSKWGGCILDYDHFDPAFFHISPREAELMDPQQRQLLMVAWHALEHAGYSDRDLAQKRCGIYVGAGAGDYRSRLGLSDLDASAYAFMGNSDAILTGRLAYFLDLRGPSLAIDTACSSSLVALHLARESLCRGEIDLALAGGVTVQSTAQFHVMASKAGMLSPTGRCHTFDNDADGFVPGEGVGLLVLKRLADALADGDQIHAVIAGSRINQDGRTSGITAPSAPSQTALELDVYRRFAIDPDQIGYVEAHGTGTRLGDPIEVQALREAFQPFTDREGFCGIGSVKTNIGHALSAAGVAGVIKAILCLKHRELVPSLHYRTKNEHIRFEGGPFRVITRNEPWPAPSKGVRHAAVSSFGFSGTNAHMVLREFSSPAAPVQSARPFLPMVLSAKTGTALRRKARELAAFLRGNPGLDPEDLAFTLMQGRAHFQYRLALIAADATHLAAQLEQLGDAFQPARVKPEPGEERAEGHALPAIWSEDGAQPSESDARQLADSFLAGLPLPWRDLFRGRSCRRLTLPVYPFDEAAYRAPEPGAIPAVDRPLHPLFLSQEATTPDATHLRQSLVRDLTQQVARVLKVTTDHIDPGDDLSDYGLDSIGFTELGGLLADLFQINLPPSIFFEHRNLDSFASYLLTAHEAQVCRRYTPSTTDQPQPHRPLPVARPEVQTARSRFVPSRNTQDEPIAVIGMAGRMPGSVDLVAFWEHLVQVDDLITEVPADRWDWRAIYGDPRSFNKCNVRYGGFMTGVDHFDPLFFGISPREAEAMDPQQRLFLEAVWHTIEDAGYRASALAGRKIGVFAGVANIDYHELWGARTGGEINAHAATGNAHSIVPNRVSFLLDFKGPSEPVDTACSSGLVAVYRAISAIREGSCEMALAGGVNVMITPTLHVAFNKAGMLDPEGHCRTFDKDANGYVRGEGVGVVLLKPLSRALADGDHVHALILGGAVSHGGHAASLTAPNPSSQAELLIEAYERTGIDPSQVSYVEAHGTGTRLGDPAEVSGLVKAFGVLAQRSGIPLAARSCALGSVKTNVGHLETAAGIAGLLKVILAMRHGQLPGNAHFRELNPYIDLGTSFYVLRGTEPWRPKGADGAPIPRIAGISSFGFGGAYAHLVVEEFEPGDGTPLHTPAASSDNADKQLFVLSARSEDRLRALVASMQAFARNHGATTSLAHAAHTSRVGREAFDLRLAVVVADWDELARMLQAYLDGTSAEPCFHGEATRAGRSLVGGEEGAGYLRSLIQNRRLERLAALWVAGADLEWQLLAPPNPRRVPLPVYPFARDSYWPPLNQSLAENTRGSLHPLVGQNTSTLGEHQYTTWLDPQFFLLRDHRINQQAILPGAACLEWARAAGQLATGSAVTGVRSLVWMRPILVGEEALAFQILLEPEGKTVRFQIVSDSEGGRRVHVQGLLDWDDTAHAVATFSAQAVIERCPNRWDGGRLYAFFEALGLAYGPSFKVITEVACNAEEAWSRLRLPQPDTVLQWHPVLLDGMLQTGAVLMGAHGGGNRRLMLPYAVDAVRIRGPLPADCQVHATLDGAPGPDGARLNFSLYDEAGTLHAQIDGLRVRPVALPHAEIRLPTAPREATETPAAPERTTADEPTLVAARRVWRTGLHLAAEALVPPSLVFDEEGGLSTLLARSVPSATVQRLTAADTSGDDTLQLDPLDESQWKQLIPVVEQRAIASLLVRLAPHLDEETLLSRALAMLRALGPTLARRRALLCFLYDARDQAQPTGIDGFARTAALEYPGLRLKVVGLGSDPGLWEPALAAELADRTFHVRLAATRTVTALERVALPPSPPLDFTRQTVLITGGAGALGRLFARDLAARGGRLILTGRRPVDPAIRAQLAELGSGALYLPADLSRRESVASLMETLSREAGVLHGVLHAAGIVADALIAKKTSEEIRRVLGAKVLAIRHLHEATRDQPLAWFAMFGSLASLTGNVGQADYAFANAYLADFADWRERQRDLGQCHGSTLCLDWPYWRDGGIAMGARAIAFMEEHAGMTPMPDEVGLDGFHRALASGETRLALAYGHAARICQLLEIGRDAPRQDRPAPELTRTRASASAPTSSAAGGSDDDLRQAVEGVLRDMASEILKIEKQHFDPEDPMDTYGFDSINLTELSSRLRATFDIELLPSVFFEYPTLRAFAGFLLKEHRDLVAARLGTAPAPVLEPAPEHEDTLARPGAAGGPVAKASRPAPRFRPRPAQPRPVAVGEPIAVVGMSGAMPGSATLEEFWQRLENGDDLVGEIPSSRWDWRAWYGDPSEGRTRVNRAGFMPQVDQFDAAFFGVSPKEAALMDPQHRLFLQAVWHAIEDAGQKPSDLFGEKVGVYVGVSSFDYQEVLRSSPDAVHAHELTGNAHSILANRISYLFNLRGPSEPVDTACSSSLVAVHRAVRALRAGECTAAIAGGVNVLLSPQVQLAFAKAGMLSPDGRCKTFDKAANGYARGEGVGALLLEPLSAALAGGHPIYGLIRGSAVNHGGRANNLVAPNPNAQAEVIAQAITDAGVDPRTIGYIEAHGTGTALGDPIEINGLKIAFARLFEEAGLRRPEQPYCALGSVKTQIGHLEAAAGIAGLVKLLLCLRHGRLQGNIQLELPNPYIRLEGSPLYLLEKPQEWARPRLNGTEAPRRAGISSFGFGGVNAHLVLEEYVRPDDTRPGIAASATTGTRVPAAASEIFPLSAKSEESLKALASALRSFLKTAPDPAQLAYTLQVGREAMPHRLAITASSLDVLHQGLTSYLEGRTDPNLHVGAKGAADLTALVDGEEGENFVAALFRAGRHRKLARAWTAGLGLDWHQAHPDKPTRIHAPGYSFAPTTHWATAPETPREPRGFSPRPDPPSSEALAESELHPRSGDPRSPEVIDFLRRRLARIAGFDENLAVDADLAEVGLDSILVMELLRDIEAEYGLRLFPSELTEHSTLAALATYIKKERRGQDRPVIEIEDPVREQPTLATTPVVFLLSTPRAGSTLLRVMVMGHSQCFAPPELHLLPFPDMATRAETFRKEGKLFLGEGLVQTLRALQGCDTEAAKAQVRKWEHESTRVFDVYAHLRSGLGGRFLVDKSPSYAASIETLSRAEELSPASSYVHLIRHPLAVADSFVRNRFHRMLGVDAEPWPYALDLWDRYNANLSHFLAQIPARRVFPLHFEDLVQEPEAVMRAFCEWLGIPFEQDLLEPYRGDRMTGGLHSSSLPIGDPNFLEHHAIDAKEATIPTHHAGKLERLSPAARQRARVLGYDLAEAPIPLAPAQEDFLSRHGANPLCLLVHEIEWPQPGPDPAQLRLAWRRLIRKHRVLRHAFHRTAGGWRQTSVPAPEPLFQVHGIPGTSEEERRLALEAVKASLRSALDPGQGRLAACGLARRDDGSATLVVMLHHLVADGLSLAFIGRDLMALYQQRPGIQIPVDDRYERYARAQEAARPTKAAIASWKSAVSQPWQCPLDSEGPNQVRHQVSYEVRVPLAQLFPGAIPAEERHARLLAGLARVLADWKQEPRVLLALRRHGRSGPMAQSYQDVVGWFACDIPFVVDTTGPEEQRYQATRDQLGRLPKDHDSYTRLSNRKQLPPLHQVASVRFNYQPVSVTTAPEGVTQGLTSLYEEPTRARDYELDWIMREQGDQLHCIVRYASTRHRESTVTALAESWLDIMASRKVAGPEARSTRETTIQAHPTHPD